MSSPQALWVPCHGSSAEPQNPSDGHQVSLLSIQAVLIADRLVQIEPVVLFADNASLYNGKVHETSAKVNEIVASLPKLQALVIFEEQPTVNMQDTMSQLKPPTGSSFTYQEFLQRKVVLYPSHGRLLTSPQITHYRQQYRPK